MNTQLNIKDLRTQAFNKFELPENEHNIYALKDKLKSMGFILKKTTDLRKKETWMSLINEDFDTIARKLTTEDDKTLGKEANKLITFLSEEREGLRKEGEEIIRQANNTLDLARAEETLNSSEIYESAIDNAEITPSIDGCTAIILDFSSAKDRLERKENLLNSLAEKTDKRLTQLEKHFGISQSNNDTKKVKESKQREIIIFSSELDWSNEPSWMKDCELDFTQLSLLLEKGLMNPDYCPRHGSPSIKKIHEFADNLEMNYGLTAKFYGLVHSPDKETRGISIGEIEFTSIEEVHIPIELASEFLSFVKSADEFTAGSDKLFAVWY